MNLQLLCFPSSSISNLDRTISSTQPEIPTFPLFVTSSVKQHTMGIHQIIRILRSPFTRSESQKPLEIVGGTISSRRIKKTGDKELTPNQGPTYEFPKGGISFPDAVPVSFPLVQDCTTRLCLAGSVPLISVPYQLTVLLSPSPEKI